MGSSCSALTTSDGAERRRAVGEKAGRWMDALDMSLGRAEVGRSDLDPQFVITNPISFYALSETKQVFWIEHLACKSVQPSVRVSQGRFCFWKWERHSLPLQRLLYSCHSWWREGDKLHHAVHIFLIVFVLSAAGGFCSQSIDCQSCSILGLYLPPVWLWWTLRQGFSSAHKPLESGETCFQTLQEMEQVVKQSNLPCVHLSSLESNHLGFLQGHLPLSPVLFSEPVFGDCLFILAKCSWVQVFTPVSKTETKGLTELSPSFRPWSAGAVYSFPTLVCRI